MRPILLRGGRVIDPSRGTDETADLLLKDGKVEALGPEPGHARRRRAHRCGAAAWWRPG